MYFVALNNEKTGPFTPTQLREMWRAGTVTPQTLFWEQGMPDWQPLELAAGRLGLPEYDSLRFAPPTDGADPLVQPSATDHEPSAYDLPAEHLPPAMPMAVAAPDVIPASVTPPEELATMPANAPDGPHALIAPTSLPSAGVGAGAMVPADGASYPPMPVLDPANQVPPAAYVSLGCAVGWPLLLFLHGIGVLASIAMMIAAVVCGHSARAAIRQSGNRRPGMGIATAGMALGYLSIGLGVLVIVLCLAGAALFVYAFSQGTHHEGRVKDEGEDTHAIALRAG